MAILGKFRVEKPKNTIRNMLPNKGGYVFCDKFILSKSFLCISLDTEVFYTIEEVLEVKNQGFYEGVYVAIFRHDEAESVSSFDISIEEDQEFDERDWELVPGTVAKQYKESKDWICFPNPEIFYDIFSSSEDVYSTVEDLRQDIESGLLSTGTLEELHQALNEAVIDEDYELAAKIRDEISKKQNKK